MSEPSSTSITAVSDEARTHDVIIVGGGVNGTGVARDCALRGLRVALFEKNDFAFGASGNNSGMIHGGPRYLTDHPEVTEQSCRDSGYIQKIAPHLLFRIPFLFPVRGAGFAAKVKLAAIDAFFQFYDKYIPLKRGKPHTLLTASEVHRLEPGLASDIVGGVTFDEWGIDGLRLCNVNALDAREHGAHVYNHTEVREFLVHPKERGGGVYGVVARDLLTGERRVARAKIVVNATGAWSPATADLLPSVRVKLRPGKGIHVMFDRRVSNYAIVSFAIDGREIFVMPWQNISWIGTTDDDFYGDLDKIRATTDEVRYLVQGVASVLPAIRDARVIGTTVGVRPTLPGWGMYESELSREHEIIDHGDRDGVPGIYSMVGGKLASYRIFAQEMSDLIAAQFGVGPCRTHELLLPGGYADGEEPNESALASRFGVPEPLVRRLTYRHGARTERILLRTLDDSAERSIVCSCEPVMECEVRYCAKVEQARTVHDVARRTRLGLGQCGGMHCAHRAAQILAEEYDHPAPVAHRMAREFLGDRYQGRVVGLDGTQVKQEELLRARYLYSGGLVG